MNRNSNVIFHAARVSAVSAVSVFLVFLMIYNLVMASGLIPGADEAVDARTEQLKNISERQSSVEGQFVDRNGEAITEPGEAGKPARLLYDEAYSYLIGYNSGVYGTSGLRSRLYRELFFGGADRIGASVALTTDNGLQDFCYRQVLGEHEGSVIVMDARTGELLACTSRSSAAVGLNANEIDGHFAEYQEIDAFFLNRATLNQDPPGSTFKIVMSASMLENGMGNFTYDDIDGELNVGNASIHNYNEAVYGEGVNMETALNRSVNVYFSSAALKLTSGALQNTAERFQIGKRVTLDFTSLDSNFDLGNLNNQALLALTAFGQGRTTISPLQISMIMDAVMNKGVIMKPFLIQTVTDNGKTSTYSKPETLSKAISADVAKTLKDYLHSTAVGYGFIEEEYGVVYAKTGTADQANGKNHLYLLMGLETRDGETYVALIDWRNCVGSSAALKPSAANLLRYLSSM